MTDGNSAKESGRALLARGDASGAIAAFEAALEVDPRDVWVHDMLGFLYFMAGRFDDAEACCRRSIDLRPDNHYAYKGLGLCLARLGDPEAGIAALRHSIELAPGFADAHHDLGVVLAELGRGDEAERCFERARALGAASKR